MSVAGIAGSAENLGRHPFDKAAGRDYGKKELLFFSTCEFLSSWICPRSCSMSTLESIRTPMGLEVKQVQLAPGARQIGLEMGTGAPRPRGRTRP